MNPLPALLAAGFALLLSAAPAHALVVAGDVPVAPSRASSPPARVSPPPLRPEPDDGSCVLPVLGSLQPCERPRQPLVSCIVPVALAPAPGDLVPDLCPRTRPAPEGRIVPLHAPGR